MKKIIPLLFLVASYTNCFSQGNFAPVGTRWHYQIYSDIYQTTFPVLIESTDTATVGGQLCYKLELSGQAGMGCASHTTFYVYESNDSVYNYLQNSGGFGLLYNFNSQLGDTINVIIDDYLTGGVSGITLVVDSIGSVTLNGFVKNLVSWSQINPIVNYDFFGPVIEDVGSSFFLFPQLIPCHPYAGEMRCFEDSLVGLYQTGIVANCNDVIGINELSSHSQINIQPNPFTSTIKIKSNSHIVNTKISIYDIPGRLVYETAAARLNTELDLSGLTKGIYMLKIDTDNFQAIKKIVKQ